MSDKNWNTSAGDRIEKQYKQYKKDIADGKMSATGGPYVPEPVRYLRLRQASFDFMQGAV